MAGIDVAAFEERLIRKRALEFAREWKCSEAVAHAAAVASVEETLNQPYELKDSFFDGLSEDRQIGIIQILKAASSDSTSAFKGKKTRASKGKPNLGVARAAWMRSTNYTDDNKLDKFVKSQGFESFGDFFASAGYKEARQKATEAKK